MAIDTISGGVIPQSEGNPDDGRSGAEGENDSEIDSEELLGDSLRLLVRQRPASALGIAAAAGFILGGGLASRQGLHALGSITRAIIVPYVTKKLLKAMESEGIASEQTV